MNRIVLACDLGGTNLRMAAVGPDGTVLSRTRTSTPKSPDPRELMSVILQASETCSKEIAGLEVAAVAVAVPATVNFEKGMTLKAPNLPCLDGFAMREALEEAFKVPAILENDANAAAVGESWLGASKDLKDSITVTLGTGVGGGIMVNGGVLRGVDGTAGEIGHICIEPDGAQCGCGSRGCVEQYASATAIVRMASEFSSTFPDSVINRKEGFTSEQVYEAGRSGDPLALAVFEKMGKYLGIAVADLINIFNPQAVVIGGGAAQAWELFIGHVREQVRFRAFSEPAERALLVKAVLGDDAGIVGVSKLAFDRLDGRP